MVHKYNNNFVLHRSVRQDNILFRTLDCWTTIINDWLNEREANEYKFTFLNNKMAALQLIEDKVTRKRSQTYKSLFLYVLACCGPEIICWVQVRHFIFSY